MRIQHNIMAMNAYRNYTNNVSAMKGNLEKLSSGYKINRAGDDAAGLAISEKMRAQITGLQQAQNNAKSAINLVQTAEGALQEVQDMLNRMVKLAEQSANGTYDDNVDRKQLQKEFEKLTAEIDRINQSANFNGKTLFGGGGGTPTTTAVAITGTGVTENTTGGGGANTVDLSATLQDGDKMIIGTNTYTYASTATAGDSTKKFASLAMLVTKASADGITIDAGSSDAVSFKAVVAGKTFDGTAAAPNSFAIGGHTFTKKASQGAVTDADVQYVDADGLKALIENAGYTIESDKTITETPTIGSGSLWGGKAPAVKQGTGDGTYDLSALAENAEITIDGKKYTFKSTGDGTNGEFKDLATLKTAIAANDTAKELTITGTDLTSVKIDKTSGGGTGGTGGFNFQVGDTNDTFNKISLTINSIASTAIKDISENTQMTLSQLDVKSETTAGTALKALKGMVNYISDIRGDLGATQNRLTHTINNLSVMTENIQDAESTIRDTDVADEMMAYTKNNILIQSAQAMLAQANQVPQGVLQLLQ